LILAGADFKEELNETIDCKQRVWHRSAEFIDDFRSINERECPGTRTAKRKLGRKVFEIR
jgi:hypothetical protein